MIIGDVHEQLNPFLYSHITIENREFILLPNVNTYTDDECIKWGYERVNGAAGYYRNKNSRIISWNYGHRWLRDERLRKVYTCTIEKLNQERTLTEIAKYDIGLVHEGIWYDHIDLTILANLYKVLSRHCSVTMVTVEPL